MQADDAGRGDAYGLTYQQIDAFLLGQAVDDETARTIIERYNATKHKRQLPLPT